MKRSAAVVLALVAGTGIALGQARLGPYVVDSNGLKVGHVQDFADVLMFIGGVPTEVSTGTDGFEAVPYVLYYADSLCATPPFMAAGSNTFLFGPGKYTTDGVIRYYNPASVTLVTTASLQSINTDGSGLGCTATSVKGDFAPALSGSATGFTPPFKVVDTLPVSPAPGTATFNDVPTTHPFLKFIEALYNSGITGGCSASPPLYCPDDQVTRGQVAVFFAKALGL
jgi:hypothetical protein